MTSNATIHGGPSMLNQRQGADGLPELKVLRPDGSWKPIASCEAMPQQLATGHPPTAAIESFIARARQAELPMEWVISTIRRQWNG